MRVVLPLVWAVLVLTAAAMLRPARSRLDTPATRPPPAAHPARGGRVRRWRRSRAAARRRRAAVARAVPDVVDLFAVAVAAGLNVRLAVLAVTPRVPGGPVRGALDTALREVESGARLADALDRVADALGDDVRPLIAALTDAERYGATLGPTLERLADDARRSRQRSAEAAARRIPVKLLFPLVTCILPAFGLMTVAPLIAGGLRALRL